VLDILEKSVVQLCQGQYWDLEFQRRPPPDLVDYLEMVSEKIGTLVGAACEIAGVLAGIDALALGQFGTQLGVVFQCRDDYLGVWGDPEVMDKTPTDLLDGKRSLPVVLAH
jgi:geranylgeranyl diphosphate synthase type I